MNFANLTVLRIPDDVMDEIEAASVDDVVKDIERSQDKIVKQCSDSAIKFLKKHNVYKSLDGGFSGSTDGSDLLAEFGLTPDLAGAAITELEDVIRESIKFNIQTKSRKRFSDIVINISFADKYRSKLTGSPFEYDSISKNGRVHNIKWMQFLLNASTHFIGEYIKDLDHYGIEYGDFGRAGAHMTSSEKNADRYPYYINKKFVSFGGENFIEDVFNNEDFHNSIHKIIEDVINRVL